ncbi:quinon protein alcohol dehydrogenase-like superfamily [Melanogaster broomeanus]|nr:quinon protein alcohol dehydrogenase-like superfamily [Melanogaster broomeanus]
MQIDLSSLFDDMATWRNTNRLARQPSASPLVLHGHRARIKSIAFLQTGNVICGYDDGSVREWRIEDGCEVWTVESEEDECFKVTASSDGQWIAGGGLEGTITIWNATTHEKIVESKGGHLDVVSSMGFSPDSARVVSGSWDDTLIVWNTTTGEQLAGPLQAAIPLGAIFSPDGVNIASFGFSGTEIWDSRSGKLVKFISAIKNIRSLAWTPDSQQLVAGCADGSIHFFDSWTGSLLDGSLLADWNGHTDVVRSITVSPNGKIIASASEDKTVRLWDTTIRQQIGPALQHDDKVNSVAISPDGSHLASGGNDEKLRIWSLRDIVPPSLLENTPSNHAPTDVNEANGDSKRIPNLNHFYKEGQTTRRHRSMDWAKNDGSQGVATAIQQRPNVLSLRRDILNPAEGHSSLPLQVPDPATPPRLTPPLPSRVESAESPTVDMDVLSLLHGDALPPNVRQEKFDRVINKLFTIASNTGLHFSSVYIPPVPREGWLTLPAPSSSNMVAAQSINEQQTADHLTQPGELLSLNAPPFPEGVTQGEQNSAQSTNPVVVPTSRFTAALDGDLKKNQKIAEIKEILIEMLREIGFPMRKNRLPWFTLEDELRKHGYTIVNWPSRVPDKMANPINVSAISGRQAAHTEGDTAFPPTSNPVPASRDAKVADSLNRTNQPSSSEAASGPTSTHNILPERPCSLNWRPT